MAICLFPGVTASQKSNVLPEVGKKKQPKVMSRKEEMQTRLLDTMDRFCSSNKVEPPKAADEDELFFQSMVPQFKRLNPRSKALARIELQAVLNKFEFNIGPQPVNPPNVPFGVPMGNFSGGDNNAFGIPPHGHHVNPSAQIFEENGMSFANL